MKSSAIAQNLKLSKGIYAIAGICKNCGKTSFLNSLLAQTTDKTIGVLTTGRDGEEKDVVFGNPKPSVILPLNTLFTATSDTIDQHGSAIEVINKLPFTAAKKQLWLMKALRDMETEITGPGSAADQIAIALLMQKQGAEIVLIDGSLDRKSVALSPKVKGVFLVVGSSFGSLDKITAELSRLVTLSYISTYHDKNLKEMQDGVSLFKQDIWVRTGHETLLGFEQELGNLLMKTGSERLYIPGAITDSSFSLLRPALKTAKYIVVRHPLHLHLNNANLDYLISEHRLTSLIPFKLMAIAVNSWSVRGSHLDSKILRDTIREQFSKLPVIDIYE